ncbi:substrate-binding domain-containing protein [Streptomyces sp. NPDC096339]|uniref:substrate-binding domain-containing protein n=1 Tax=Streptomyces sp. NPDC096339 TaxID=3366086 RepID=UPI003809C2C5
MTRVPGPTIADIARAAELSTATVSYALSGTGRLADGTRRRPGAPLPDDAWRDGDHAAGGRQVLAAAARHGIRIPADLLLVCASEDPVYAQSDPPVITVTPNPERTGAPAMSALVALVESGHAEATGRLTVPAGLRVRASSLPPDMY